MGHDPTWANTILHEKTFIKTVIKRQYSGLLSDVSDVKFSAPVLSILSSFGVFSSVHSSILPSQLELVCSQMRSGPGPN